MDWSDRLRNVEEMLDTPELRGEVADIREAPNETAVLVFRAEKNVLLELVEPPSSTWIKVRHRDGQVGFVSISQVWGI